MIEVVGRLDTRPFNPSDQGWICACEAVIGVKRRDAIGWRSAGAEM